MIASRVQLSVWLGKKQMFRYLFRMYVTQKWQALLIMLSPLVRILRRETAPRPQGAPVLLIILQSSAHLAAPRVIRAF